MERLNQETLVALHRVNYLYYNAFLWAPSAAVRNVWFPVLFTCMCQENTRFLQHRKKFKETLILRCHQQIKIHIESINLAWRMFMIILHVDDVFMQYVLTFKVQSDGKAVSNFVYFQNFCILYFCIYLFFFSRQTSQVVTCCWHLFEKAMENHFLVNVMLLLYILAYS